VTSRPQNSEEFERRAASAFWNRGRRSVQAVALELGVSKSRLYYWSHKYGISSAPEEPSRTGYTPAARAPSNGVEARGSESERGALIRERDQLLEEVRALRKTIVLLGRG